MCIAACWIDSGAVAVPPLIAHIVFRLDYGGLENGVVNLVNGLPESAFRHAVIALIEVRDFAQRVRRADVGFFALNKRPGKDPGAYWRLYRLLRQLRPTVVHTRNLGTIEGALVARLAGVPFRVHSEHGWDQFDPHGTNRRHRLLRRFVSPAVDRFVALSREIEEWLRDGVGIHRDKLVRICNGVDTQRFRPGNGGDDRAVLEGRFPAGSIVVGSVTRFNAIKDPLNLVRAFIAARRDSAGARLRLVIAGDGPLHASALDLLREAGEEGTAWLPGSRDDIPQLLRAMDVFVLGSLREGISNTVLEAMASGLPVVASATGGNLELVQDGVTGRLVGPTASEQLSEALLDYARDDARRSAHGRAARVRAEREYSLERMLADYEALYRHLCGRRGWLG
jgi:sugar transferase (PEP-CTERM/EpsH1 system associated)